MITIEEINKLKSRYNECCKKYKEKSEELQKLSDSLNGAINSKLTKCEKESKDLDEQLLESQSKYRNACKSFVDDKLSSMGEIEREMFCKKHVENMRMNNWEPVIKDLLSQ